MIDKMPKKLYVIIEVTNMNYDELLSINTIPKEIDKSIYEQSERGLIHTSYRDEIRLFSCIKEGNSDKLLEQVQPFLKNGIFVGEMSDNNLMQFKYIAVSTMALATRYAIQGGLNELTSYSFSDEFIRNVDELQAVGDILILLAGKIMELTEMVKKSKDKIIQSPHIRKSIAYINKNITKKITVKEISQHCGISADYLSHLFKKEIGDSLSNYILKQKLELAKTLLWEGADSKKICSSLGFCSQSHFTSSFKKEYNITPGEYISQIK